MNEETTHKENEDQKRRLRNLIILYLLVIVAVFFAGFLPMWTKARESEKMLVQQKGELRDLRLQALLANAAIDARRGDYEPARRSASDFFTSISGADSAMPAGQNATLNPLLSQRDEIITLLARSDPASAERLTNLYLSLRSALGSQVAPAPKEPAVPMVPEPTNTAAASTNQ